LVHLLDFHRTGLTGSFLILTFLATVVPPLYFALTWFVLAFSTAFLLLGPSWVITLAPVARSRFGSSQYSCHKNKSISGEKQ
jgi:hypothetical protein